MRGKNEIVTNRDFMLQGWTVSHCEAFRNEEPNCFELGKFGEGFRIVFTNGQSLEIAEESQSGRIQAWVAGPEGADVSGLPQSATERTQFEASPTVAELQIELARVKAEFHKLFTIFLR